jgi:hypothetical protein
MLSVVIPTMWKYKPFEAVLPYIVENPSVGQVIIINNDNLAMPDLPCFDNPKLNLITPPRNLYVNPSWNLGVNISSHSKICLYSDDVVVDPRLFEKADEFLNDDVGVLGACPGNVDQQQPAVTTGEIDIVECSSNPYISNWAFGSCFFITRKNWKPIPEELKIWYGDTLQWEWQLKNGRKNYLATNLIYYSPQAITVNSLTEPVNVDMVEDKFYAEFSKSL